MAKRKVQTVKKAKPKKRMTRANKLSLEEMHYGPEPEVGYFDDHTLSNYLNWFNYMYDRKKYINNFWKIVNWNKVSDKYEELN